MAPMILFITAGLLMCLHIVGGSVRDHWHRLHGLLLCCSPHGPAHALRLEVVEEVGQLRVVPQRLQPRVVGQVGQVRHAACG